MPGRSKYKIRWCTNHIHGHCTLYRAHIQKELISNLNSFFVKEIMCEMNYCKRLKRLTNEEQHCYIFFLIQQNNIFRLVVN
jgi:hypothetical protein